MAFRVRCLDNDAEKVVREGNIYAGRSPESVAKEVERRFNRLYDGKVVVEEGEWDDWYEEFVPQD